MEGVFMPELNRLGGITYSPGRLSLHTDDK